MTDFSASFLTKARVGTNDELLATERYPDAVTIHDHDDWRHYYSRPADMGAFIAWAETEFSTDDEDCVLRGKGPDFLVDLNADHLGAHHGRNE